MRTTADLPGAGDPIIIRFEPETDVQGPVQILGTFGEAKEYGLWWIARGRGSHRWVLSPWHTILDVVTDEDGVR